MHLKGLESFTVHWASLKSEGTPSDITRSAEDLKVNVAKLLQADIALVYMPRAGM